jgi:hypothetical protein
VPAVRSDIRKRKALDWLVEHVELVDEDGQPVDRAALKLEEQTDSTEASEASGDEDAEQDAE